MSGTETSPNGPNGRGEGRGARGDADPLDVALDAVSAWEELANDLLAQTGLKNSDKLELYVLERRAINRIVYAQAYQAAVTNRLLGHLVHAVKGLERSVCVWSCDHLHEYWTTSCGREWALLGVDPVGSEIRFCPGCGGILVAGEEAGEEEAEG